MVDNEIKTNAFLPCIIQGGMGVGVSNWTLANAVSREGGLGVVSGTALGTVLIRRLQAGDVDGHVRRALAAFPWQSLAEEILDGYFVDGGIASDQAYKLSPLPTLTANRKRDLLEVVGGFVEVWLAKEGHTGQVGINLLEKIQLSTLATIYGAMLAGVDAVLMGAGIPRHIPGLLDAFAAGKTAELRIDIAGGPAQTVDFDPSSILGISAPTLRRPYFIGIVSAVAVAMTLARKANGKVDGFVIEGASAGGHNAPPRGYRAESGEQPVYSERDLVDLKAIGALGIPFWLAGNSASADALKSAIDAGAQGVQVGTAFAFCNESGLSTEWKQKAIKACREGTVSVRTDGRVSPTGMPFKVVDMPGTLTDPAISESRERRCDLGYLRQAYYDANGKVGFRCAAAPVAGFVAKGGTVEQTEGKLCLCNSLLATIGMGQKLSDGSIEPALLTAGESLSSIMDFIPADKNSYSAADVMAALRC
jgi:NAD(P)H-dependent flavin oxidoreductase YrpB (nitropropane dioxygenase family)